MARLKDEHLALTSGIGLAGVAVANFYEEGRNAFEVFNEEVIGAIVKPNKETAVHWYLWCFQDIEREIKYIEGNEELFYFIYRTLKEVNLTPEIPKPEFDSCIDEFHKECVCEERLNEWIKYIRVNCTQINELIIHSAFQVIFQDRRFLHDFHLELSYFIEDNIDDIKASYPEYVTKKGRIKRRAFPKWMTNAVFYRDKGTCSICRSDLSNLLRTQNIIHIDHIIPLSLFGSNDASNFQLLCESCNTSKGARSTNTSSVNVPFWNYD